MTMKTQVQTASTINFFLGIWLLIAPFALGYSDSASARWNDIVAGAALLLLAGRSAFAPAKEAGLGWACAALGAWLVIAPFALGNSDITANVWNDLVVGLAVAIFGGWSAFAGQRVHGGGREHRQVRWLRHHDTPR
ncbi:MAG: SPW repeat protein [Mycobacterium sp.]|jgi:threonine/homoserine efflux transporter RhtA|nr:SPW repeat protein [Mycobacterium sp.]MBV8294118.1 SPW repeat protein [Mycobacterium sp.]